MFTKEVFLQKGEENRLKESCVTLGRPRQEQKPHSVLPMSDFGRPLFSLLSFSTDGNGGSGCIIDACVLPREFSSAKNRWYDRFVTTATARQPIDIDFKAGSARHLSISWRKRRRGRGVCTALGRISSWQKEKLPTSGSIRGIGCGRHGFVGGSTVWIVGQLTENTGTHQVRIGSKKRGKKCKNSNVRGEKEGRMTKTAENARIRSQCNKMRHGKETDSSPLQLTLVVRSTFLAINQELLIKVVNALAK